MAYQLMGAPERVAKYPDGQHNWIGNRTKATIGNYKAGLEIIDVYEKRALYWQNRVPFLSARFAIEGATTTPKEITRRNKCALIVRSSFPFVT